MIDVWLSGAITAPDKNMKLNYQLVGNTRNPKGPVNIHNAPEPRIQELFLRYANTPALLDNVDFKLEAIEVIENLYGAFSRFMHYQFDSNYLMNGLNLNFLKDTIQYIVTGRRDYSLLTWNDLVVRKPEYLARTNGHQQWHSLKAELGIKDDRVLQHYISMWCSRPGGFEDMLYTTWILFGSPDSAELLKD